MIILAVIAIFLMIVYAAGTGPSRYSDQQILQAIAQEANVPISAVHIDEKVQGALVFAATAHINGASTFITCQFVSQPDCLVVAIER